MFDSGEYRKQVVLTASGIVDHMDYIEHHGRNGDGIKVTYYITTFDGQRVELNHYCNLENNNELAVNFAKRWISLRSDKIYDTVLEAMIHHRKFDIPEEVTITKNTEGFIQLHAEKFAVDRKKHTWKTDPANPYPNKKVDDPDAKYSDVPF